MCINISKRNIKQLGFYSNTNLSFLEQKKKKMFESEKKKLSTCNNNLPSSFIATLTPSIATLSCLHTTSRQSHKLTRVHLTCQDSLRLKNQ